MSKHVPPDNGVDTVLGELRWDAKLNHWRGEVTMPSGEAVTLMILSDEPNLSAMIETLRKTFQHVRDHEPELRAEIANAMLKMAEDWRDEEDDPEPVTLESFVRRVKLKGVALFDDGCAQLYYDDDDIFAAHTIVANLSANGELEAANISG